MAHSEWNPEPGRMSVWSWSFLFDSLSSFESDLRGRCGNGLSPGESITQRFGQVLDLISRLSGEIGISGAERRAFLEGLGLADLAIKYVAVSTNPELSRLCAHFRELLQVGALVQNTGTKSNEAATNTMFEALIALSVLQFGSNVEVEPPKQRAAVRNPDVMFDFGGKRWSLACKVVNPASGIFSIKTYSERVRYAVEEQIEKAESAERGFVVVNLKNALNYDELWPPPEEGATLLEGTWPSLDTLGTLAEAQVSSMLADLEAGFGNESDIDALFCGKRAVPLVLNYVSVSAPCMRLGRPVLTNLRMLVPLKLGDCDREAEDTFAALDRAVATP